MFHLASRKVRGVIDQVPGVSTSQEEVTIREKRIGRHAMIFSILLFCGLTESYFNYWFTTSVTTLFPTKFPELLVCHIKGQSCNKDSIARPNIVLFYADDMSWHDLGRVNGITKTPHLDNMAANGMDFRYNCVIFSICWVSRATLVTGLYASIHKHLRIPDESLFGKPVDWSQTLYPLLKANGYNVGYIGKW